MTEAKHYAGVGSRRLPLERFALLRGMATALESRGWVLRSGGAKGCDSAFESGVRDDRNKQIFYPDRGPIPKQAFALAAQHHPAWHRLSGYAKRCHARNCMQVLGPSLDDPSAFVLCWTPGAQESSGTAQAMRVARANEIEIFNIADEEQLAEFFEKYLQSCPLRATTDLPR